MGMNEYDNPQLADLIKKGYIRRHDHNLRKETAWYYAIQLTDPFPQIFYSGCINDLELVQKIQESPIYLIHGPTQTRTNLNTGVIE